MSSEKEQERVFRETIEILEKSSVLPHVTVIGTWAEYLFKECRILNYTPYFKTKDADFLIPDVRKPYHKVDLASELEKNDYVITQNYEGLMKFTKGTIEVEFLTPDRKHTCSDPTVTLDKLGITAQPLRHMDIIYENTIPATFYSHRINIPKPAAYVLHKLAINELRSEEKQKKDIQSIDRVLDAIKTSPAMIKNLQDIFETLTGKQKGLITASCQKKHIDLGFSLEIKKTVDPVLVDTNTVHRLSVDKLNKAISQRIIQVKDTLAIGPNKELTIEHNSLIGLKRNLHSLLNTGQSIQIKGKPTISNILGQAASIKMQIKSLSRDRGFER